MLKRPRLPRRIMHLKGKTTGWILAVAIAVSCQKSPAEDNLHDSNPAAQLTKSKNVTTLISTDTAKLGKLLDFTKVKPEKVKFKYIFIDNSRGVPGPSDSVIEAVLYFDAETFRQIRDFDKTADFESPDFIQDNFKFEWLDQKTLAELKKSDKAKSAHPDFFFSTFNGKCWYLDNKILLTYATN